MIQHYKVFFFQSLISNFCFVLVSTMSHQTNLTESVHKLHDSNNKNGIENDDIDEEEELDPRVQVVKFNHISYFSSTVRILTVES